MDFIKNNLDIILIISKWTLLVLATGFVAQFGKQFASYLISIFRKARPGNFDDSANLSENKNHIDKKQFKELVKIEKKKIKNLKKSQKG